MKKRAPLSPEQVETINRKFRDLMEENQIDTFVFFMVADDENQKLSEGIKATPFFLMALIEHLKETIRKDFRENAGAMKDSPFFRILKEILEENDDAV